MAALTIAKFKSDVFDPFAKSVLAELAAIKAAQVVTPPVVTPPVVVPPVVVPPVVTPPSTGPAPYGLALKFEETFPSLDLYHPTKNPKGKWRPNMAYGGDGEIHTGQYPGLWPDSAASRMMAPMDQPWVAVDPNYAPDLPSPFSTDADGLTLTMRKNPKPDDPRFAAYGKKGLYACGLLTSKPSFIGTFGYYEYEVTIPVMSRGAFPQLWLWNELGDELDILEGVGVFPNKLYQTMHMPSKPGVDKGQEKDGMDFTKRHKFGVRWTKTDLIFTVDREETFKLANPGLVNPMYFVFNLAAGGWSGNDTGVIAPATMKVHSVRAWQ